MSESISAANTSFTLQTGRDLLTSLQAQDPSQRSATDFSQALESANSITDTLEIHSAGQTLDVEPTSSALFQAHLGALAVSQGSTSMVGAALSSEEQTPLKVASIDATAAAGPFANGQSGHPDEFRPSLTGIESLQVSQYPAATGADGSSGAYGAGRTFRLGARLDLKG